MEILKTGKAQVFCNIGASISEPCIAKRCLGQGTCKEKERLYTRLLCNSGNTRQFSGCFADKLRK